MVNEFQNKLCVSFFAQDIEHDAQTLRKYGFCEVRLDHVSYSLEQMIALVKVNSNIILCSKGKSPNDLLVDLKNSISACPKYVDVDMDLYDVNVLRNIEIPKTLKVILSKHFDEPVCGKHVENYVDKCTIECGKLYKIVGKSDSYADISQIVSVVDNWFDIYSKPIVFNIGDKGRITRIYSILTGAPFGYCATDESEITASGQMRYSDMLKTMELFDK